MSSFIKNKKESFSFVLKNIDVAKIDKSFNMEEIREKAVLLMEHTDSVNVLNFETDITAVDDLGISSLRKEPIKTIVPKEKTYLETYAVMIDITSRELPANGIPCFGCRRKFDTLPLGIPIRYHSSLYNNCNSNTFTPISFKQRRDIEEKYGKENVLQKEYFDVDGVVCSFNCILLYLDENSSIIYKESKSLIPLLYKSIFGQFPAEKILKAPNWRLRAEYGGPLSDEEYVKNLQVIRYTDTHQIIPRDFMQPISRIYKLRE